MFVFSIKNIAFFIKNDIIRQQIDLRFCLEEANLKTSTLLKWITGGLEVLLGIPFLGASIIVLFLWFPLMMMLALHIVTLIMSVKDNTNKHGSILGIITSIVGFIPIVGMIMHLVTGILLLVDAGSTK